MDVDKIDKLIKVGEYTEDFNSKLGINQPCLEIYQSTGLEVHINKNHPDCVNYLDDISDIINAPDYIGINPNEDDSIELIKNFGENIKVAIKLDKKNNYFYVASLYDIKPSKISRHLKSGRLKRY